MRNPLPVRDLLVALVIVVLTAGPGLGASSDDDDKATSDPNYAAGTEAVKAGRYAEAIPLLEKYTAVDPTHADTLNHLGYSHRKLGNFDDALTWYGRALAADPDHRGANEYLGELYLQMGKLDKAEERLAKLDSVCFFGCEEYDELKQAIAAYKSKN